MQQILVVDDELPMRNLLKEILGMEGYTVRLAHDGRSALDAIAAEAPDLIFLDLMMPGMDGNEVLRDLRDRQIEIPVVVISARADAARMAPLANQVIQKPFSLDDVIAAAERWVPAAPSP